MQVQTQLRFRMPEVTCARCMHAERELASPGLPETLAERFLSCEFRNAPSPFASSSSLAFRTPEVFIAVAQPRNYREKL